MTEADLQRTVMQLARLHRWRVAHHHDSRRQVRPGVFVGDADAAGLPDLVMTRPPRLLMVELKSSNGRLSREQAQWGSDLRLCPGVEYRLWTPGDLDEIAQVLK